jgi:hypothetical protein
VSFDQWSFLVLGAFLELLAALHWRRSHRPGFAASRGRAFALKNLAFVEPRFVPAFDAEQRKQAVDLCVLFAGSGAAVAALGALPWEGRQGTEDSALYLVIGPMLLAHVWVGLRALARQGSDPVSAGWSTPMQQARRPATLQDYLPRGSRIVLRLCGGSVLALTVVLLLIPRLPGVDGDRLWRTPLAAVLPGMLIGYAYCEYRLRRLPALPEPADAAHLYWQDALRAQLLDGVVTGWISPTTLTFFAASFAMTRATVRDWDFVLSEGASGLAIALTLVSAGLLLVAQLKGGPWFRRRLWPTLKSGQVLMPGEPVPPAG